MNGHGSKTDSRGRGRMVVGFKDKKGKQLVPITTKVVSSNPAHSGV